MAVYIVLLVLSRFISHAWFACAVLSTKQVYITYAHVAIVRYSGIPLHHLFAHTNLIPLFIQQVDLTYVAMARA